MGFRLSGSHQSSVRSHQSSVPSPELRAPRVPGPQPVSGPWPPLRAFDLTKTWLSCYGSAIESVRHFRHFESKAVREGDVYEDIRTQRADSCRPVRHAGRRKDAAEGVGPG